MREVILRVKPWSPSAFLAAVLAIALAASVQEMFAVFGAKLYFAAFFPAILAASVLAGAPSGILATGLTIPIVWWAFMGWSFPKFSATTRALASAEGDVLLQSERTQWRSVPGSS